MEMPQNIQFTFGNKIEIPENIRINVLIVLLSSGRHRGVPLDCFQHLFEQAVHEPLQYQTWGYSSLLEFLRAIPDVSVEYDKREEAWKVYGMQGPNTFSGVEHRHSIRMMEIQPKPRTDVWQREVGKESYGFDIANVCNTEPDPVDVDKLVLVPDDRGLYSVCFPRSNGPCDWQSLKDIFSMAGSVTRIYGTTKMVFVTYDSPDKAKLALKMFPFLGVRLGWRNDAAQIQKNKDGASSTSPKGESRPGMPELTVQVPRMERNEDCLVDVMVENLDAGYTITRVHIEDLFQGYDLHGINIVYNRDLTAKSACITLGCHWEAEELVSEFDGYDFCGKQLSVYMKDDKFQVPSHDQVFEKQDSSRIGEGSLCPFSKQPRPSAKFEEMHSPQLEPVALCMAQVMEELERTPIVCRDDSLSSRFEPMSETEEEFHAPFSGQLVEEVEKVAEGEKYFEMSPLELEVKKTGVEVPAIFVSNFRSKHTEKDIHRWFSRYRPLAVHIVQNDKGLKKAHIELPDKQMVRRAVIEMFHHSIGGRQLNVDVPYFLPNLRREILGTRGKIFTPGRRRPHVIGDLQDLVECRNQVMVALVQTSPDLTLRKQVEVIITNVITETLFFGQVVDQESTESLKHIADEINKPCQDPLPPRRNGPCIVQCKQDNQFCRGWIMGQTKNFVKAEVYCVDTGHLEILPKQSLRSADEPWIWDLPPQAMPFTLTEPVVNLKGRLGSPILLEIWSVGKSSMVVAKALSLMPDSKKLLEKVENLLN